MGELVEGACRDQKSVNGICSLRSQTQNIYQVCFQNRKALNVLAYAYADFYETWYFQVTQLTS
jgi:hypothetical protein